MPTNKRPIVLTACCFLVLLCAAFPPREFAPDDYDRPSRKFLFSSEIYLERIGTNGRVYAHVDGARFAAELLVILSLTGIAFLTPKPQA